MTLGKSLLVFILIALVMIVSVAGVDLLKDRVGNPPIYIAVVVGGYLLLPLLLCFLFDVHLGENPLWKTYLKFLVATTVFLVVVTAIGSLIL